MTYIKSNGLLRIAFENKNCSLQTWLMDEAQQLYQSDPKGLVIRTTHPTSHYVPYNNGPLLDVLLCFE